MPQGLVRAIGVSNMGVPELRALAATATAPIAVNQIELHPWCWWPHVVDYCKQHGILLQVCVCVCWGRGLPRACLRVFVR
jgi:diketogulonate reductase-like aldo/keto reductase